MRLLNIRMATMAILLCSPAFAADTSPDERAAATAAKMTPAERTVLTHGIMAIPARLGRAIPPDAVPGAGYVPGIPRLNVPSLKETDASLGVAYVGGLRKDGATALPSGMAMASTWNPALMRTGGAMIGAEAHAKGFNVLLAGGSNLMRDPRNGRTFEYLGEDPLLTGLLSGAAIRGIQSAHVISTIKHFALNDQETGRKFVNSKISDAAARESDLLAFEIAIEQGQPGSVMCSYNQVNGHKGCSSDYLLKKVLKKDWGYKGFVMADWGAVPDLESALNGLDQQSAAHLDAQAFLERPLAEAAAKDKAYAARLNDMNRRVLRSMYAVGIDSNPPVIRPIDFAANGQVAQTVAEQAIVLLRNQNNALPLAAAIKRIAVIGGHADSGVLSGAGSSQVAGEGGPALAVPVSGEGLLATMQYYHRSSPLKAMRARAPQTEFIYRDGRYLTDAVEAAKKADVAIVFATQWMTEGFDVPDLNLPSGQDALIDAVAAANPHTIVVLETGGPVLMPWLDKTAGVLEAWYPGARGGEAIARVLYGDVNPSGHLPGTFPAGLNQLPRPVLPGSDTVEPNRRGIGAPGQTLEADYDVEGSNIGYRWFAATGEKPLFPFGYGLSYTSFSYGALQIDGSKLTASFTVTNSGKRAGSDVAQLYLINAAGQRTQRLVGFQRVDLAAGESTKVTFNIDPRLVANWNGGGWTVKAGTYQFALGQSATDLSAPVTASLVSATLKP